MLCDGFTAEMTEEAASLEQGEAQQYGVAHVACGGFQLLV
jgi:hypothetical protein